MYHVTGISNALSIVSKGRFELKPSDGTMSEELQAAGYYLSCARSLLSSYLRISTDSYSVIFELDGNAIQSRYKIVPVDYWGSMQTPRVRAERNEMEDRVVSRTNVIPIRNYIKAVHAIYKEDNRPKYIALKKFCLVNKIPLKFYSDYKGILNRKEVQVRLTQDDFRPKVDPNAYVPDPEYVKNKHKYYYRKGTMLSWLKLYYTQIPEGKDPYEFGYAIPDIAKMLSRIRSDDIVNSLNADMHNAKGDGYGELKRDREFLDRFVSILRKHKWKTKDYITEMQKKWGLRKR